MFSSFCKNGAQKRNNNVKSGTNLVFGYTFVEKGFFNQLNGLLFLYPTASTTSQCRWFVSRIRNAHQFYAQVLNLSNRYKPTCQDKPLSGEDKAWKMIQPHLLTLSNVDQFIAI